MRRGRRLLEIAFLNTKTPHISPLQELRGFRSERENKTRVPIRICIRTAMLPTIKLSIIHYYIQLSQISLPSPLLNHYTAPIPDPPPPPPLSPLVFALSATLPCSTSRSLCHFTMLFLMHSTITMSIKRMAPPAIAKPTFHSVDIGAYVVFGFGVKTMVGLGWVEYELRWLCSDL